MLASLLVVVLSLPTFAERGTVYMVTADDKPVCEAWTIDPTSNQLTNERRYQGTLITRTIEYQLTGSQLVPTGSTRTPEGREYPFTQTCPRTPIEIRETPEALVLDSGAQWFRTEASCRAAIARRTAVATQICVVPLDAWHDVDVATQRRFERVLARGGTLYSIVSGRNDRPVCQALRVDAGRQTQDSLTGSFTWRIRSDEGRRGTQHVGYRLSRGALSIWLSGPSTTWERDRDGTLIYGGYLCEDEAQIEYERDVVHAGDTLYFTARACRRAIQRANDEELQAMGGVQPGLGC